MHLRITELKENAGVAASGPRCGSVNEGPATPKIFIIFDEEDEKNAAKHHSQQLYTFYKKHVLPQIFKTVGVPGTNHKFKFPSANFELTKYRWNKYAGGYDTYYKECNSPCFMQTSGEKNYNFDITVRVELIELSSKDQCTVSSALRFESIKDRRVREKAEKEEQERQQEIQRRREDIETGEILFEIGDKLSSAFSKLTPDEIAILLHHGDWNKLKLRRILERALSIQGRDPDGNYIGQQDAEDKFADKKNEFEYVEQNREKIYL